MNGSRSEEDLVISSLLFFYFGEERYIGNPTTQSIVTVALTIEMNVTIANLCHLQKCMLNLDSRPCNSNSFRKR